MPCSLIGALDDNTPPLDTDMDSLSAASLDWALKHVSRFGDTDLLPVPFEYQAIAHAWGWLRDELTNLDLNDYRIGSAQRFLIPKPSTGFRVVAQLDPIDAIIYTAMIYEVAEAIEKARVPAERNIACSYRVSLDGTGAFFRPDNGWPHYHERSRAGALDSTTKAIVVADISDFYNQIYHHRLENALDDAGVGLSRRKAILGFLSQLTATQSRGIPVGPYASILLAETCLNDVDGFLLRKGYEHTRYVDDFRIFCRSRRHGVGAVHDLTEYLYTAQRLSLVPGKTRLRSVDAFLRYDLRDPDEDEKISHDQMVQQTLQELAQAASAWYGGEFEEIELDDSMLNEMARENVKSLFEECVSERPLSLGLARHLLRRATQLRTNILLSTAMMHLDVLAPVLRDLVRYLRVAIPKGTSGKPYGSAILAHLAATEFADVPYVHLWFLELLRLRPEIAPSDLVLRAAESAVPLIGLRMTALLAKAYRQGDWIRSQKEIWRNHRDWDRRAILASAAILPKDEREHWLAMIQGTVSGLDRAVAQFTANSV
jgi:hypothetical protein